MKEQLKIGFIIFAGVFLSAVPFLPADPTPQIMSILRKKANAGGGGGGQSFSDDFTGTNGDPLSSDWTTIDGTWEIQSNQASHTASGYALNAAYWDTTQTDGVDQYAKATINDFNGNYGGGVILRCDGTDYYQVTWYTSGSVFWNDDTDSLIESAALTFGDGDTLAVTCINTGNDTEVRIWVNPTGDAPDAGGTTWGSAGPDQTFTNNPGALANDTGKYVGIFGASNPGEGCRHDDWFGGDVP